MKWICFNIVSLTCIVAAGTIAALGKDGWGWFPLRRGHNCAICGNHNYHNQKSKMKIETHKVNPVNDLVDIEVIDQPGAGGAHHEYLISWPIHQVPGQTVQTIKFQNGPIAENGVNGLTQEVLLAIVQHRLECFQKGPYACRENAIALTHVQDAMHWLQHRTRARMARGVEGTMAK